MRRRLSEGTGVTQVYLLHVGGKAGTLSLNLDNT